jgi:DNA-binding GntR family transcriptional regulator
MKKCVDNTLPASYNSLPRKRIVKVRKANLSEQVYKILKQMIGNYRFVPGSRLNVEQLTRDLGVSRTPIWEAVRRLEQEGLVKNEAKKGVSLVELTPGTAVELYTVREVLEGLAIRLAVERMDDHTIRKMAECLKKQKDVIRRNDLIAYSQLDFDFHGFIYGKCGNRILQEMLENVKNKARPIPTLITPIFSTLYQDHALILKALKMRDPERAEKAVRDHNRNMIRKIMEDTKEGEWASKLMAGSSGSVVRG